MKILVVDDHPIVRAGLRRLLASKPETEIREAPAEGGVERIQRAAAHLGHPGSKSARYWWSRGDRAPENRGSWRPCSGPQHARRPDSCDARALQAGAAGYVSKNAPPDEILEAIGRVSAGQTYIEHEIAEDLVFSSLRAPSHPLSDLSARDFEILRLLAEGRTLVQIADTVGISYKTAANNCSRIKAKLGASSTADLIRVAVQCGLIDRDAGLSTSLSGGGGG